MSCNFPHRGLKPVTVGRLNVRHMMDEAQAVKHYLPSSVRRCGSGQSAGLPEQIFAVPIVIGCIDTLSAVSVGLCVHI